MKTRREDNPTTEERDLSAVDRKTINTEMIAATGKVEPESRETIESHYKSEPELSPLFSDETEQELRTHWHEIQTGFVDEKTNAAISPKFFRSKKQSGAPMGPSRKNINRRPSTGVEAIPLVF
jgi:hypothetical protein